MKKVIVLTSLLTVLLSSVIAYNAQALIIAEIEPNNSFATAQNIDAYFSLGYNPDIGNTTTNTSTTIPWVSIINNSADNNPSWDYYSFTVPTGGGLCILDIDYGMHHGGSFDPWLYLYNSAFAQITHNDDNSTSYGQGGSIHPYDPYIEQVLAAGLYYVSVGAYPGRNSDKVPAGGTYVLQVSVGGHPANGVIPEPTTLLLLGSGLLGFAGKGFIRRKHRG